jgi:hypothetical protein
MEEYSNDLKVREGEGRMVHGSRIRKAVPPPTIRDLFEEAQGRGVEMSVNPEGIES